MTKKTPSNVTNKQSESDLPHNTSLQLSFDIFKTLDSQGIRIERSDKEIGFRKNNLLITVSELTLDQKRILDIVFFIAAQSVEPNAIQREYVKKTENGLYEVDLNFFKWLLSLSNPRNSRLKELMSSVQSARLQAEVIPTQTKNKSRDAQTQWQTHNFFGSALIDAPAGIAAFSINPTFEQHIQSPQAFHFLSLRHVLPNLASKLLYDWLLLFEDYSEPITLSVEALRKALGQEKKRSYQQFGAFNRAFLTPAIQGVNESTNLHVTMETHRVSPSDQTIGTVSFTVVRRSTQKDEEDNILRFMRQYKVLRDDFGLQNAHFEEIFRNRDIWTDERIEQAKDYTLARLQMGNVKSVSGYFMKALKEGYVIGNLEKEQLRGDNARLASLIESELGVELPTSLGALVAPQNSPADELDREAAATIGWGAFNAMSGADQLATIDAFCSSPYIEFIARAVGVDATNPDALMEAANNHPRMHAEFGRFALKQQEK